MGAGDDQHKIRMPQKEIPDTTILVVPIRNNLNPVTRACLQNYGKGAVTYWWLDPSDEDDMAWGMFRAIKANWNQGKHLIFIDHDMVFTWENLRDFYNCPDDWCVCPYWSLNYMVTAPLGFSFFSAKLQSVVNLDLVEEEMRACEGCRGEWWGVEWHLFMGIRQQMGNDINPCEHSPVLNDHPMYGLKSDNKTLEADFRTPEGRHAIVKMAREHLGWKLEKEPESFEEVVGWEAFKNNDPAGGVVQHITKEQQEDYK